MFKLSPHPRQSRTKSRAVADTHTLPSRIIGGRPPLRWRIPQQHHYAANRDRASRCRATSDRENVEHPGTQTGGRCPLSRPDGTACNVRPLPRTNQPALARPRPTDRPASPRALSGRTSWPAPPVLAPEPREPSLSVRAGAATANPYRTNRVPRRRPYDSASAIRHHLHPYLRPCDAGRARQHHLQHPNNARSQASPPCESSAGETTSHPHDTARAREHHLQPRQRPYNAISAC